MWVTLRLQGVDMSDVRLTCPAGQAAAAPCAATCTGRLGHGLKEELQKGEQCWFQPESAVVEMAGVAAWMTIQSTKRPNKAERQ